MNTTPHDLRIEGLARRHGMEHALLLGDALGNALIIASDALAAVGRWMATAVSHRPAKGPASQG